MPWQAYANALAVNLAEKAAAQCQLPCAQVSIVNWHDARARIVLKRLVAVPKLYSDWSDKAVPFTSDHRKPDGWQWEQWQLWPHEHNGNIRVGSANWTHTNTFCRMVQHECAAPPDHTSYAVPVQDGKIDKASILGDPRQSQLAKYLKEGMICSVFPYWVAETYPLVLQIFQSAASQAMQVQEGDVQFLSTHSLYIAVLRSSVYKFTPINKGVSSTLSYHLYRSTADVSSIHCTETQHMTVTM